MSEKRIVKSGESGYAQVARRTVFRISALHIALAALFTLHSSLLTPLRAQQVTLDRKNIPHLPTDTMPTDRAEVRLVTFSDGTYRFIPTNPYHFSNAPAYGSHWDTLNLFAYRTVALADLPSTTDVELPESQGFHAPTTGPVISPYGRRNGRDHNGVDVRMEHGQPVFAAFDGIVRFSRWNSGGFGNLVIVRHPNGLETYYAHLSRRAVVADEWVRAGSVIGYAGRTGRASTVHLHFEMRYADQSFDPERLVDFGRGTLRQRLFALHKDYFNIRSRATEGVDDDSPRLAEATTTLPDEAASQSHEAPSQPAAAAAEPPKPTTQPVYHKIKSGDTLLAIALEYHTTVAKLCDLNGISRTSTLRIGRNLRIE
jgi:murein DD-endopeptidase MepM/ murein hydrolase activator NlpD